MIIKNKTVKVAIISSVITFILTSAIAVTAITLTAKDISFTSTNENWQANNVEDAMNDLYQLGINNTSKNLNIKCSMKVDAIDNAMGTTSIKGKTIYFTIYKRGDNYTSNLPTSAQLDFSVAGSGISMNNAPIRVYYYGFKVESIEEA